MTNGKIAYLSPLLRGVESALIKLPFSIKCRMFLLIFLLVSIYTLHLENSDISKQNEALILSVYNKLKFPPHTKIIGYKLERKEERCWLILKFQSTLSSEEVVSFYDTFFISHGGRKENLPPYGKLDSLYNMDRCVITLQSFPSKNSKIFLFRLGIFVETKNQL